MHQLVSANLDSSRRWVVLAIVVSAQFMFGVDVFIVNNGSSGVLLRNSGGNGNHWLSVKLRGTKRS